MEKFNCVSLGALKLLSKTAGIVGCLFACAAAHASLSILDTGATTVAGGTVDANWTVSLFSGGPQPGPLTGSAYLVPNGTTYNANSSTLGLLGPGPWLADDSTSSWISYYNPPTLPDETGDTMQYQLIFTAANSGMINISWLSDNTSQILLNGTVVGTKTDPNTAFEIWSTTSSLSLVAGTKYTVDLDVYNNPQGQPTWGNPTGGRVEFSGPVSAVPEPTTVISGALLLLPFGASTLRILRRNRAA